MRLTPDIISKRLGLADEELVSSGEVEFKLYGVRFFPGIKEELSEEVIYIVRPEEISNLVSGRHLTFISLGQVEEDCIDGNWTVMAVPEETDKCSIFQTVQGIFDEYGNWAEDVNKAIFTGENLQLVLDKAAAYLENPVALFDNCQGLLMKSGEVDAGNLDSIWSYVLEKGYSFKETEDQLLKKKIQHHRRPFHYHSADIHKGINRLIAPVYLDETYFGVLAMTELNVPFTRSEYAHLCLVQDLIQNALKVNQEYVAGPNTPWFLHRLIVGKYIDGNMVSYHMGLLGRKVAEKFFLWCFSMQAHGENQVDNAGSMHHLSRIFDSSIVFSHENMILVCDYDLEHYNDVSLMKKVNDFLSRTSMKASMSMKFNDIFEIYNAFKQCQIADDFGKKDSRAVSRFDRVYADYVLSSIDKNIRLGVLVDSDIRLLDPENESERELLRTLRTYLINGKNLSATAKDLSIHRHTVVYRLNKLEESFGIDLETSDEDLLFQMYLSCRILLRKEK